MIVECRCSTCLPVIHWHVKVKLQIYINQMNKSNEHQYIYSYNLNERVIECTVHTFMYVYVRQCEWEREHYKVLHEQREGGKSGTSRNRVLVGVQLWVKKECMESNTLLSWDKVKNAIDF